MSAVARPAPEQDEPKRRRSPCSGAFPCRTILSEKSATFRDRALRERLFRFLVVGSGAAALLFVLSFALVSAGLAPFAASTLAYAVAFVVAYSAQRGWTFGAEHSHGHALPRYFVLQAACALFSGVVSHVAVSRYGMSPLTMSALTTVIASAASFLVSSLWVFPERG